MVNITDVKQILQFAIDAEIKVFLDGGWGVDALLGYQSRAHNDIDIFVEKNDYQNFIGNRSIMCTLIEEIQLSGTDSCMQEVI